jgi:hypothetical protein
MKNTFASILVLCLLVLSGQAQRSSSGTFLPADTLGWHLTEAPRSFIGDELFNMIDGGAALYQEYGFDRAIAGKYEDSAGRAVDVEIYAMVDAAAACGIFGITAAAGDQGVPLGDDGELGEYFLVCRKGRHVVTVSGQNADKPTIDGVKLIGRAIESRIDSGSIAPRLVRELSPLVSRGSRPIYLRGVIAVGNFYIFAPQNVFDVHQGVTGERDSTRFFVFCYTDAGESAQKFGAATEALRTNAKFSNFESTPDRFTATDRDGNLLRGSTFANAIIVVIGRNNSLNKKMESDVASVVSRL